MLSESEDSGLLLALETQSLLFTRL